MSRFHTTPDGDVPFTPEEEIARELEESGAIAAKPMNAWMQDIQATDSSCPRWFEDYVTENSVALAPGKSKDSYDAKVQLRSEKP